MSLAEQIQRVDGGQNDTLKAILTALGVTVGTQKIDQLAALAATISPKLKPDNLNSAETNALFGLGADAVPDDVFVKIKTRLDETSQIAQSANNKIVYGSFIVPNGKVTLPFEPAYVILSGTGSSEASIFTQTSYRQIRINGGGYTELSLTGSTLKWENFEDSDTIYYIAINK